MYKKFKIGQNVLEYAIVLAVVIVGLVVGAKAFKSNIINQMNSGAVKKVDQQSELFDARIAENTNK